MHFVLYVIVGITGGFIGGVFGVGGGIIIVPALILGFGFTQHMAQGTMLAAFLVSLGMMVGSVLGSSYAQTMSGPLLKKLFGILMVLVGMSLIFW